MIQDNSSKFANDLSDKDDDSCGTIKFYEGVAEALMNDSDTLKDVKIRAKNLAEQDAQQKISDYINEFLKVRYLNFPDDEILSITNEIFQISNISYGMQDSGGNEMIIQATVTAKVDDNDIMNCLVGFFNERTELKSENETLHAEIDDLKRQTESFHSEVDNLRRENNDLKSQNESLRHENDNLKRQTESLHVEINNLHRENEDLKFQMESLRHKNDDLKRQTEQLLKEIKTASSLRNLRKIFS